MKYIYMDNASTTSISDVVLEEMMPYLKENYANPSSLYTLGQKSRAALENSRIKIAKSLGVKAKEIYFTSCATESNNWILNGIVTKEKNHIITSKIEHPAIIETCKFLEKKGIEITFLNVDRNGFVDLEELNNSIKENTALVSIMYANNEIGVVEPIEEIEKICHNKKIPFHTDAVQALGNIKLNLKDRNISAMSFSGHKIRAPKGVGILYLSENLNIENFMHGGAQERRKRAGTENLASIVGLSKAFTDAQENVEKNSKNTLELREYMLDKLLEIEGVSLNGSREKRLPGNINISIENIKEQMLVPFLDSFGICISQGSACSAGSLEKSHVLKALGLSEEKLKNPLRISINYENTYEEADFVIEKLKNGIKKLNR